MASESKNIDLSAIPSNVSGDGSTFVKGLKKYLNNYGNVVDEKISNIGEGSVNQITGLTLSEEHRTNSSGNVNDIRVQFTTDNITDYSFAQVWMRKESEADFAQVGNTSGLQYLIENVAVGVTYYVKVVACNNNAGYADFDDAPVEHIAIRGSSLLCNTPAQFYWSNDDRKWHWGSYTDNGYTDFFELRTDQNAGVWNEHRLDSVPANTMYSTVVPSSRSGTAYLYVRNIYGQYNSPATHQYSITAPSKPSKPTLTAITDGVSIALQALPSGCFEYIVDVDGVEYEVFSTPWVVHQFFGTVTVKYCFVDSIGRSQWSDSNSLATGRKIVSTEITDGAITTPKLYANAVTAGCIASNAITSDKINASAVTAAKIATGAITIGGSGREVTIADGAINGSKITAASIIGDKIAANSIRTSHLYSENIELTGSLAITGGAVRLDESGLKLTAGDGSFTIFNTDGINFYDSLSSLPYSQVSRMLIGECPDGKYVRFSQPWKEIPNVICVPASMQISDTSHSNTNLYIVCRPRNVSRYGFYVDCYLKMGAGSTTLITTAATGGNTSSTNYTNVTVEPLYHSNNSTKTQMWATSRVCTIPITIYDTDFSGTINISSMLLQDDRYVGAAGGYSYWDDQSASFSFKVYDSFGNVLHTSGSYSGFVRTRHEGYTSDGNSYLEYSYGYCNYSIPLSLHFNSGGTTLYVEATYYTYMAIYYRVDSNELISGGQSMARTMFKNFSVKIPTYTLTAGTDSKVVCSETPTAMFLAMDGGSALYTVDNGG